MNNKALLLIGAFIVGAVPAHSQQSPSLTDCVAAPPGLIGWWAGEGTLEDLKNGNTGITENPALFASGKVGTAFKFSSPNSYVRVPPNALFGSIQQSVTLEAWVNHASLDRAIQRYVTITPDHMQIGYSNGAFQFALAVIDGTTKVVAARSQLTAVANKWYHIAGTYNGSEQRLYVNGELEATVQIGKPMAHIPSSEVYISFLGEQAMAGLIDEVALYDRALSVEEIKSHFRADAAGLCKVPTIASVTPHFPGEVHIRVKGQSGRPISLDASSDLIIWNQIETDPNPKGSVLFVDLAAATLKHRFYRAKH